MNRPLFKCNGKKRIEHYSISYLFIPTAMSALRKRKLKRVSNLTCSKCHDEFSSMPDLVAHLLHDNDCKNNPDYLVCRGCASYASKSKENFMKHLTSQKGKNNNCKEVFEQAQEVEAAPIPTAPDIQESNSTFQLDSDVDIDFNMPQDNCKDATIPKLTYVYQKHSEVQYVQFESNDSGYERTLVHKDHITGQGNDTRNPSTVGQQMLQRSGNIMAKSTGTHSNVLTSLPGMSTEKFIHHSEELMNFHTNSDYLDERSQCSLFNNGSSSSESSLSSREILEDELDSFSQDDDLGTIRLVRESAISTTINQPNDYHMDSDEDLSMRINQENGPDNVHSDSDSTTSLSSVDRLRTRQVCELNIKNVLDGKQVRFPIERDADGTRIEDGRGTLESMTKHFADGVDFTPEDNCLLDLFELMQSCNAPRGTFDKVVEWAQNHSEVIKTGSLRKRKTIMANWMQKYGGDVFTPLPTVFNTTLSSGKEVNISTFSFRNMILSMIADKDLFKMENLLIDPQRLNQPPEDVPDYGEPNTGSWYREALERCCPTNKHLLLPFAFFIDELKLDKFGKLGSEVVLACCQIFKRHIRNTEACWFPLGFVEDQKNFKDTKGYVREKKMQDYHDMLKHIFREFRSINSKGGIKVDIDFQDGRGLQKDIILVPVIQYVIGDCKGNDVHCGRKGTHSLNTPNLCRDCNIPSEEADNPHYPCRPIKMSDIRGKSKADLEKCSHYKIDNAWWYLSFGGCPYSIHCNCPHEILHNFQLGFCDWIGRDLSFTSAANEIISDHFTKIYPFAKCQSDRNMPNLRTFRKGLSSVKSLKGTERFDRVFALWLTLMSPSLQRKLSDYKQCGQEDVNVKNTTITLHMYIRVLEDTLMIHEWLKLKNVPKDDVTFEDDEIRNSNAHKRLVVFAERFRDNVVLDGYECKTTKFHQLLHTVWYILRVGSFCNVDGSIGEKMGKEWVKEMSKTTNKDRDTLSTALCLRIAEKNTVKGLLRMRERRVSRDHDLNCSIPLQVSKNKIGSTNKKFTLEKVDLQLPGAQANARQFSIKTVWKKGIVRPLSNFPDPLLLAVVNRLFHWNADVGGRISNDSKVSGFTDYVPQLSDEDIANGIEPIRFRANPHFRRQGEWFDWGLFKWEGYDDLVPARIMMFLDLSECEIIHSEQPLQENENQEQLPDGMMHDVPRIHYLDNEKFAVIQSVDTNAKERGQDGCALTDEHFQSIIGTWVQLENKYRIVPLDTLDGPAYVVDSVPFSSDEEKDNTALVVSPMDEWPNLFLPKNRTP